MSNDRVASTNGSNLSRPPRHVPLYLRILNMAGGGTSIVGWIMIGATSFILWHGNIADDLRSLNFRERELAQVDGRITRVVKDPHFMEVGFDYGEDRAVYVIHYSYKTLDGATEKGILHRSEPSPKAGDIVTVEYPKDLPMVSQVDRDILEGDKGRKEASHPDIRLFQHADD